MTQRDYQNAVGMAKYYSHMYYVASAPVVSDQEFDALIAQIEQTEQEHPEWTLPDSPTQVVGSDLFGNNGKIRHRTPMLSCQKAKTLDAVAQWINKTNKRMNDLTNDDFTGGYKLVAMWKYDGISCSLVYQDGVLISAATRGNGKIGQDITAHVRCIPSVPQELRETGRTYSLKGRIEVRGEIVCRKKNLALLTQRYTDCRTAASSLCNQDVPYESDLAMLDFMPWEAYIDDAISSQPQFSCTPLGYPWHKFDFLSRVCFINRPDVWTAHTFEDVQQLLEKREQEREAFEFPVDGIVLRVMHDDYFRALGATEHHPHGSIAYKFAAAKTVSRVTRIEVTVGKTGKRTPVVHFEPVTILDRTVRKASVGSEATLQKLGIKLGCMVEVGLANDVRPTVYRVIEDAEYQAVPATAASLAGNTALAGSASEDNNDPLAGIDFPDPEETTALAGSPSENDEQEEAWLAPSINDLFPTSEAPASSVAGDGIAETAPAPAASPIENEAPVPAASPAGNTAPAGSASGNESKNILLTIGAAIFSLVALSLVGIVAVATIAFGFPLLNGSLKA